MPIWEKLKQAVGSGSYYSQPGKNYIYRSYATYADWTSGDRFDLYGLPTRFGPPHGH